MLITRLIKCSHRSHMPALHGFLARCACMGITTDPGGCDFFVDKDNFS